MSDIPRHDPPDDIRCQGRKRITGERCRLAAVDGSEFCAYHGGGNRSAKGVPKGTPQPPGAGGPPPKGNTNAMTYGAYTPRMPAHLEPLRQMYVERFTRALANPNPFDIEGIERAAGLQTKFAAAIADPECPVSTLDTLPCSANTRPAASWAQTEEGSRWRKGGIGG